MSGESTPKLSKVEFLKRESAYLRGKLPEQIAEPTGNISEEQANLLKFHGSYQQDDRDVRVARRREGQEPAHQFMIRVRQPGGRMTAEQYLAVDRLAREVGNGTLRITTRQEFQLHGVLKKDLKSTIRAVNEVLLTTLATCGDVARNVLSCPSPEKDPVRDAMMEDCLKFVGHCAPRSSSYWDIWLDGEKIDDPEIPKPGPALVPTPGDDAVEPIYGQAYMPRKFKTAFALPYDNCTDVYANDLGYLAVVVDGKLVGYNVLVGGGMGTTPSAAKTFPAVAKELCFIGREDVLRIGEAVMKVQRDFGNRADRKRARLKYLVYDLGIDGFRQKVEEYIGEPLTPPRDNPVTDVDDHLGWRDQRDGKLYLGIPIENGRVKDEGNFRLATALRGFFQKYGTPGRLTCLQSLILCDIDPAHVDEINAWLSEHGIVRAEEMSNVRRWSMACPALPTCGLAVTESERVLPTLMNDFEQMIARQGLGGERFSVHMTGCPNGCARPYNCDIGLVGRSASRNPDGTPGPGKYTIFLGGNVTGTRLNVKFRDYVPMNEIVSTLEPAFERFRTERISGETFGDFCQRLGVEALGGSSVEEEAEEGAES